MYPANIKLIVVEYSVTCSGQKWVADIQLQEKCCILICICGTGYALQNNMK